VMMGLLNAWMDDANDEKADPIVEAAQAAAGVWA
jgi:hypothetical protein